jgi:hypothetical protein
MPDCQASLLCNHSSATAGLRHEVYCDRLTDSKTSMKTFFKAAGCYLTQLIWLRQTTGCTVELTIPSSAVLAVGLSKYSSADGYQALLALACVHCHSTTAAPGGTWGHTAAKSMLLMINIATGTSCLTHTQQHIYHHRAARAAACMDAHAIYVPRACI